MVRVAVNPEIIKWALRRTREAESVEKKFPSVIKWLQNETQPTLKQLEQFAKATATPLGYFFLSNPPEIKLPIPHYRTLDDSQEIEPSPDLLETVRTMERRQAWMREYLIEMGHDPLPFVGSCRINDSPKEVAAKIRMALGIQSGWAASVKNWEDAFRFLMNEIENIGILVVRNGVVGNNTYRKLDVREFRGFVLVDEFAPLVFINGADGKAAQMFTLAHELAHIWFGASAVFDLSALQPSRHEVEQACNQIAAELLVPEDELRLVWRSFSGDPDRFHRLAKHFKVSSIVVARRSLDLNLIERSEFFKFYSNWIEGERRKAQRDEEGGANFYFTQKFKIGRKFAEAVIISAKEGRIPYGEAYRLTGLRGETFDEFARRLGFEV